jgi:CDP-6-deoxy-D-xylo-4-hexulose-3-dehydrase
MPSEISAAFALVQLENLDKNINQRIKNYNYLRHKISESENIFIPSTYENVETGWIAFPMILINKLSSKRREFQIFLEKSGIQTRTIFTGNILRQPVSRKFNWESFGSFNVCDEIMKSGILLGCHNRQSQDKLEYICLKVKEAEEYLL